MSDIAFNCPYCEQKIEASEETAGAKSECPSCQCEIQIPNLSEPASRPAPLPSPAPLTSALSAPPQFVAAKCPSCGGDLQVPNNRDQVKCMYCGGAVIIDQAIQLVSGVNVANLIELAKAAVRGNNYKEAYDYYTKVLEFDPMNSSVWVGKGEAAGWMSTLADIRVTEMVAAFNNAINYAQESDKPAYRKHFADVINRVTSTCYGMAKKHLKQFVKLDNTWPAYLKQCGLLIAALEVGHLYDPDNKTTLENIIHISADNIGGISFSSGLGLMQKSLSVTPQYKALLKVKIDESTAKMYRLNPSFVKPQV